MTKSFSNDSDNSDEYNDSSNEEFNNMKPDFESTIKFLKTQPKNYIPLDFMKIIMISQGNIAPKIKNTILPNIPLTESDKMLRYLQHSKPIYNEIKNNVKNNLRISYNYNQKVLDEIINSILNTHKNQQQHKDIIKKKISQALFKSIRSTTSYDVKIIDRYIKIHLDKLLQPISGLFDRDAMKRQSNEIFSKIFSQIKSNRFIHRALLQKTRDHMLVKNIKHSAGKISGLQIRQFLDNIKKDSQIYVNKYTTYAKNEIEKIIKLNIDEIVETQISRLEQQNKLSTSGNNSANASSNNKNKNKNKSMLSIDIGPTQQILIGTTLLLFSIMVVFLIGKS
jgi:hypothetical protein